MVQEEEGDARTVGRCPACHTPLLRIGTLRHCPKRGCHVAVHDSTPDEDVATAIVLDANTFGKVSSRGVKGRLEEGEKAITAMLADERPANRATVSRQVARTLVDRGIVDVTDACPRLTVLVMASMPKRRTTGVSPLLVHQAVTGMPRVRLDDRERATVIETLAAVEMAWRPTVSDLTAEIFRANGSTKSPAMPLRFFMHKVLELCNKRVLALFIRLPALASILLAEIQWEASARAVGLPYIPTVRDNATWNAVLAANRDITRVPVVADLECCRQRAVLRAVH